MKIYTVSFNDGGWHSGPLPSCVVVAETKEESISMARKEMGSLYNKDYAYSKEFKIEGYVIKVYDEKSYYRDKKIDDIL